MTTNNTPLFSAHEQALAHSPCPQCGGELVMRFGKRGPFLGCDHYPTCDYIQPLNHNDGHVVKELDMPCPECESPLVLRQGRYGMFIGCSAYPACHYLASTEKKAENTDVECPECHKGHLTERKSRYGKVFYACDQYPSCRFAVNNKPVAGTCQQCGFGLLIEKKLASGVKLQCADRKCHAYQEPESLDKTE
ncbi:DNA topoisomerase family protein [Photobacterium leiognathi]|uniref:DNA topoisomerase n=1 Tax=Photobacterium leiognathi subsp. mandapamensis TaxID=48408 RepID=A0A2T3KRU8_PHOLD|nr:topoisomerase DNA-binding C4 zinc finger domain-containing protein [Photobacterium leiognathi]PSV09010.1 DNA topoisomerase [Photobacterium leiognathi subsp. mandapamensis]PSW41275.1 DNA topoisomerase [Photobacterium leiognathi subsp. mandapamensis]PSW55652.1 DNA topoisomerase [Photobacterium leiognathi subsp. mandapamensis]